MAPFFEHVHYIYFPVFSNFSLLITTKRFKKWVISRIISKLRTNWNR